jgi:hypothetical protein
MNLRSFFAELKLRNVYKIAIAYAAIAWLLMQIVHETPVARDLEIVLQGSRGAKDRAAKVHGRTV